MSHLSYNISQLDNKNSPWIAVIILLLIVFIELFAILHLNTGKFLFTLDDAYIHLALAENLLHGHYGVNINEYSSPSSSILWPFLITPLAGLEAAGFLILIINLMTATGCLFLVWKIMRLPEGAPVYAGVNEKLHALILLILFILASNLVGLIFTGMEHSVQLFLSITILFGLIYEIEHKQVKWWFASAIIIAPLVRYECLALSLPAVLYLYLTGYRAKAAMVAGAMIVFLTLFSILLVILGLEPLPNSVLAKSALVSSDGRIDAIVTNIRQSLSIPKGTLLAAMMLIFISLSLIKTKTRRERLFTATMAAAICLHLMAGQYGWYGRYEPYIWTTAVLALLYMYKIKMYEFADRLGQHKAAVIIALAVFLFNWEYAKILFTIPVASNNIYQQHYQMSRFVKEYYRKPVAVNDIGYVSYNNNEYVLDLYGLASQETLKSRLTNRDPFWMDTIVNKHNVKLAMFYDRWYRNIPANWQKVGEMQLARDNIALGSKSVSFYIVGCDSFMETYDLVRNFASSLPQGIPFKFNNFPLRNCQ